MLQGNVPVQDTVIPNIDSDIDDRLYFGPVV